MSENFNAERAQGCIIIKAKAGLILSACDELQLLADELLESTPDKEYAYLVLDVNQVKEVGQNFIRAALHIQKNAKSRGKELVAINASRDWKKYVSSQGVSLPVFDTIGDVLAELPADFAPKHTMPKVDVNFINPFIEGAINTLRVQCSVEARPGKLYMKGHGPSIKTDIAGVIGLVSKGFRGTIAIAFPQVTFLAVMGKMLGEQYTEINKDLEDGAGELLNIIFGQAKVTLNQNKYAVEKAIPTVVRGQNIAMSHLTPRPTIILPFQTDYGPFEVQISVDGDGI